MCRALHPRARDKSENEIGDANLAFYNDEDEEQFFPDVESFYSADLEIVGLRGINYYLRLLGEEQVVEDNWRQLPADRKLLVFDWLEVLNLEVYNYTVATDKGKDALGKIMDIVAGQLEQGESEESL